jgi:hypothetical protein
MQHFGLGLAASGALSLQLPSGRTLEFTPCVEALRLIEKIMLDHAESPERVMMTQWEADQILKAQRAKRLELSAEERRAIQEEKEQRKREAAVAKAKQDQRAFKKATGIDPTMLKISI